MRLWLKKYQSYYPLKEKIPNTSNGYLYNEDEEVDNSVCCSLIGLWGRKISPLHIIQLTCCEILLLVFDLKASWVTYPPSDIVDKSTKIIDFTY